MICVVDEVDQKFALCDTDSRGARVQASGLAHLERFCSAATVDRITKYRYHNTSRFVEVIADEVRDNLLIKTVQAHGVGSLRQRSSDLRGALLHEQVFLDAPAILDEVG